MSTKVPLNETVATANMGGLAAIPAAGSLFMSLPFGVRHGELGMNAPDIVAWPTFGHTMHPFRGSVPSSKNSRASCETRLWLIA